MSVSDKDSKQEKLRVAIQERVNKEEHAFRLVEKMVLLDSVDKETLLNAGKYIAVSHYKDVIEERAITKLCGYPLCRNRMTQVLKQKYKISVRENKVYDISERKNFCSNKCYKASKYFESQLSVEPVWMRGKTKSPELKLLEDGGGLSENHSGSGEEVLMNTKRNYENMRVESEPRNLECESEHDDKESEDVEMEHDNADVEHEDVDWEHDNVRGEHEVVDWEHEDVGDGHENISDEDEDNEHEKDNHEYDSIHKLIRFDNNELGCVVERIRDVKIDLDFDSDDSNDSDDIIDDVEDSGDSEEITDDHQEKLTQNSENGKNSKKITMSSPHHEKLSDTSCETSRSRKSDNHTTKMSTDIHSNTNCGPCHTGKVRALPDEKHETSDFISNEGVSKSQFKDIVTVNNREFKNRRVKDVKPDRRSLSLFDGSESNEKTELRKLSVFKVYQVLQEWCSLETKRFLAMPVENEEIKLIGKEKRTDQVKGQKHHSKDSVTLPSIDSNSQIAIRGKIVSEKLTKAMSPMLNKLSVTKADISSQLTCILKTFRFTNTNIVLKPSEWTLIALVLLLVLAKQSPSLKELLVSRQKSLHSLVDTIVCNEDDVEQLLGVFDLEENFESAATNSPSQFDMEELD